MPSDPKGDTVTLSVDCPCLCEGKPEAHYPDDFISPDEVEAHS